MIIVVNGHPGTDPFAFAERLASALELPYSHFDFYEPSKEMVEIDLFGMVFTGDASRLFPEAHLVVVKLHQEEIIFQKAVCFLRIQGRRELAEMVDKIQM